METSYLRLRKIIGGYNMYFLNKLKELYDGEISFHEVTFSKSTIMTPEVKESLHKNRALLMYVFAVDDAKKPTRYYYMKMISTGEILSVYHKHNPYLIAQSIASIQHKSFRNQIADPPNTKVSNVINGLRNKKLNLESKKALLDKLAYLTTDHFIQLYAADWLKIHEDRIKKTIIDARKKHIIFFPELKSGKINPAVWTHVNKNNSHNASVKVPAVRSSPAAPSDEEPELVFGNFNVRSSPVVRSSPAAPPDEEPELVFGNFENEGIKFGNFENELGSGNKNNSHNASVPAVRSSPAAPPDEEPELVLGNFANENIKFGNFENELGSGNDWGNNVPIYKRLLSSRELRTLPKEKQSAAKSLGYTNTPGNALRGKKLPSIFKNNWNKLNPKQKKKARILGINKKLWNQAHSEYIVPPHERW